MGSERGEPARRVAVMAVVGLVVLAIGLISTRDGLYIGLRDAPTYLSSSENLASGNGFVMSFGDPGKPIDFSSDQSPVIDFPIGYPAVLSSGNLVGLDSTASARWIGIATLVLIALTAAWIALASGLTTSWSIIAALTASALSLPYLLSPISDLLYGLLLMLTLGLLGRFVRRKGDLPAYIGAVVVSAASMTVRTIGMAAVATVAFFGLAIAGTRRAKIARLAAVVVIGSVPVGLLLAGGGSRDLAWHPPGLVDLKVMANTVAGWFVPPIGGPTLRVALFVVAVLALVVWVRLDQRSLKDTSSSIWARPWVPGVFSAVAHFLALLGARLLFDAQNSFNPRLLYPAILSLLVAGISTFSAPGRSSRWRLALGVGCVAMLMATSWTVLDAGEAADDPSSFGSEAFRTSPAVRAVLDLSSEVPVFSNVPDGLWVAGRSGARPLPVTVDPLTTRPNPLLEEETGRIRAAVDSGAVIFYRRGDRDYMLDIDQVRATAACVLVDDGTSLVLTGEDSPLCGT